MKSNTTTQLSILRLAMLCAVLTAAGMSNQARAAAESGASIPTAAPPNNPSSGYRIGPGDILQINVLRDPDASVASVIVRSDGVISLPLIKEVAAGGMTPTELERFITSKLSRLIRDPEVTVVMKEIHSEKIYLLGAVKKEGAIPFIAPLTVLQAVAEAGGLTDYAKRSKIYILRQEASKQVRISFDYSRVIKGEHMELNIMLRPGDTVVVPH